jgi:enoyl-CoA hydratase/carnithine racemase
MAIFFDLILNLAKKSPVAVQASKILLKYSREHSTYDGLRMNCVWSMSMLQSEDLYIAAMAQMNDKMPDFNDL